MKMLNSIIESDASLTGGVEEGGDNGLDAGGR